jgi:hypothetical protein
VSLADPAHALFLACGCPASLVYVNEPVKALWVMYGYASKRRDGHPQPPTGSRIRAVDGPSVNAVVRQLQAAGPRRFECRSAHHVSET